jgi:hypothetical protein
MTEGAEVTYAAIARRRLVRWHVSVPGIGRTTTFRRSRVEAAAQTLVARWTGKPDASVAVLSRPRS